MARARSPLPEATWHEGRLSDDEGAKRAMSDRIAAMRGETLKARESLR